MVDHTGSKKKAYIVSESQLQDTRLNIFDKQGRRRSSRFQRDGTGTMGEVLRRNCPLRLLFTAVRWHADIAITI